MFKSYAVFLCEISEVMPAFVYHFTTGVILDDRRMMATRLYMTLSMGRETRSTDIAR